MNSFTIYVLSTSTHQKHPKLIMKRPGFLMTVTDLSVTHNGMYPPSWQIFLIFFFAYPSYLLPSWNVYTTFQIPDILLLRHLHSKCCSQWKKSYSVWNGEKKKISVIQSSTSQSTNYLNCWNHYIFRVWEPYCIFNPIIQSLLKNSLIEHKNKPRCIVNGRKKADVLREEQSYRPRNIRQWDVLWMEDVNLRSTFCSYYFCFEVWLTLHVPTQVYRHTNPTLTLKTQAMPQVTHAHSLCATYHRADTRK